MAVNWDDLKYFLSLYRKHTFVAAAADLKVTHSTVARRITALEEALQTRLFHRTERGCHLTSAGEGLVAYAERMESMVIGAEGSVSGGTHQLAGTIRIGAPDGIGNSYLADMLVKLQSKYRALEVELLPVPQYYSLSKREIDILISVYKPQSGNIVAKKLTPYRLGLFATEDYLAANPPLNTTDDLKKHRLVGYIDDLLFDPDLQFFSEITQGVTPVFKSATVLAQLRAVSAGAGIGIIPYFLVGDGTNLLPVLPEIYFERNYWLQVNPDTRQLARVRRTIDFITAEIAADRENFISLP